MCATVCVSVSVSVRPRTLSLGPLDRSSRNFVCRSPVAVARSSSGRRCDMLCRLTSGFMDDAVFGRNGPYGDSGFAIVELSRV